LLCLVRLSIGLNFQSIPALAPFLIDAMQITYAQLGALIGLFMFSGAFLALPGALFGDRFGDKAVVLAGLALLTVGAVLFASSTHYSIAAAGRLLSGAGGVLLTVQLPKITTDWFAGREISTAMGILIPTWPLGIAIALATLGGLATVTSWQTAVHITALYSGLALLLFLALYRDPPRAAPGSHAGRSPLWAISNRELALVTGPALMWMFLNTGFILFMSFTPSLLIDRGLSPGQAGFLVSWASLVCIGSFPLAGYLIDRTRKPNWFIVAGTLATVIPCVLVTLLEPAIVWIVLFGLMFPASTTVIITLPGEVLRPESRGTGFGVFYMLYYLGMALVPPVAGYLLDVTRSPAAPLLFSALLWLMTLSALPGFRRLQRRTVSAA
jgi:MFS family permease